MNLEFLFILSVVLSLSIILNLLLIGHSSKLKLMDAPNSRSMHKIEKSRAGGIAIFLSFLVGMIYLEIAVNIYIVVGFFIVFIFGIYDDIFGYSSKIKFFWLSMAAIFLCFGGMYIENLGIFLGVEVVLPTFFAILFFIFAIVGFINAMNLIDGLDGLSSGIAIVMLGAYAYLGFKYLDIFLLYTSVLLIASLTAFLFFNWYPSKLFMGDSGSLTLGFIIAVLSIHSVQMHYISAASILLITALPILDTLIVMIRRIRRGKNPFNPDMTHLHHIILSKYNKNVAKTTKIIIVLQIIFSSMGLGFDTQDGLVVLFIFVLLFALFYALFDPKNNIID